MEEKMLVMDCLKSLNEIIAFENDSILKMCSLELRSFFKSVRTSDENYQEELRNLGMSKGYLEKNEEVDTNKIDKLKQNLIS